MATRLLNILTFSGLVVGVPSVQAHGLNAQDVPLIPDFIFPVPGGYTITATSTTVTVTRPDLAHPATMTMLVWRLHTVPRQIGASANLTPQPYIIDSLAGNVFPLGCWHVTTTKIGPYAAAFNEWVPVNPTAGGFILTLPLIAAANSGCMVAVKNVTSSPNPVTITAAGGQTVDGLPSTIMAAPFAQLLFVSDGVSNWMIG